MTDKTCWVFGCKMETSTLEYLKCEYYIGLTASFPGKPGKADTRKVKPV